MAKNRINYFNFEHINISPTLNTKFFSDFFGLSLYETRNISLTEENTVCNRRGTYITTQPFDGWTGSSYLAQSKFLDINDPDGYFYVLIKDDIHRLVGDTVSEDLIYSIGFSDAEDFTLRLRDYSVFGYFAFFGGAPGSGFVGSEGRHLALIYSYTSISTTEEESRLVLITGDQIVTTPTVEYLDLAEQGDLNSCLFFQGRLVTADDVSLRMSTSISSEVVVVKDVEITVALANQKEVYLPNATIPSPTSTLFNGLQIRILSGKNAGDVRTVPSDTAANYNVVTEVLTVSTDFTAMFEIGDIYTIEAQISTDLVNKFNQFDVYEGAIIDTDAIEVSIFELKRDAGGILWVEAYKDFMIVGATQGLYFVRSLEGGQALSPLNIEVVRVNDISLSTTRPVIINNIIYVFNSLGILYAFNFDWRADAIQGIILNTLYKEFSRETFINSDSVKLQKIDTEALLLTFSGESFFYIIRLRGDNAVFEKHSITPGSFASSFIVDAIVDNNKGDTIYGPLSEESVPPGAEDMGVIFLYTAPTYVSQQDTDYELFSMGFYYPAYNYLEEDYDLYDEDEDSFEDYLTYLDGIRELAKNTYLDQAHYYSGSLLNDGSYYFVTEPSDVYTLHNIYINKGGRIYGPYISDSTSKVYISDEDAEELEGDFYYGIDYKGFIVSTSIENRNSIKFNKKLYGLDFFLYGSGSFDFRFNFNDYISVDLTKNNQLANKAPALFTGTYPYEDEIIDDFIDMRIFIQTKTGTPFHLTGYQLKLDENSV